MQPRAHLSTLVRIDSADVRGPFIRLDRNERVSPLPDDVLDGMLSSMDRRVFSSYADPLPLIEAFAADARVPRDFVVATNGSDAAIRRAFQAFVSPGDVVVTAHPTYAMYGVYAQVAQARVVRLEYSAERTLPVDRWLDVLERDPVRLLCLVNPDNPTAAVLPREDLLRVIGAAAQRDVLCLVDEAYYPCFPGTAIDAVRTCPNVIVTRSLSKAYGLGGLRVGFACAQPPLIEGLQKVRGLHEVNAVAVHAGTYLLARPQLVRRFLAELEAGREVLARFAVEQGFVLPHCPTNFQLVGLPSRLHAEDVAAGLRQAGYLVRGGFEAAALRNCLRITLDAPPLMQRFVRAFADVVHGLAVPAGASHGGVAPTPPPTAV